MNVHIGKDECSHRKEWKIIVAFNFYLIKDESSYDDDDKKDYNQAFFVSLNSTMSLHFTNTVTNWERQ